jgi:hypothetical protein
MPIPQAQYAAGQYNPYQQQMMIQNPQYGQMQNQMVMNTSSQPGLSIVPVTSDDQITNYPVASGNTVVFINFNTNRLCFKSTNQNAVTMPLQWASFTYDQQTQQQNNVQQNQNDGNYVSRQEFDELRMMMQQTLNAVQNNQQFRQKKQYDNKRRHSDDRPENVSANDE